MKHNQGVGALVVLPLMLLSTAYLVMAQGSAKNPSATQNLHGEKLKLVIILSRHGVRSPTWEKGRLDAYSASPWPIWNVPPGYLTPHGFELLKTFGKFDRSSLAQDGLITRDGCKDSAQTYIWADTGQRTTESGRALAEGMFPNCPPVVHGTGNGDNDPLFHPANRERKAEGHTARMAIASEATSSPNSEQQDLLVEMQHVLMGCDPKIACTTLRAPQLSLLDASAGQDERNNSEAATRGPLAQASTFAENLLLEYTEGMPSGQVGWGKVDELTLRRFVALHSENFALTHRTPTAARTAASNMLFHIVRTLAQNAAQRPVEGAVGPVNSKIVMLVGHDTNIAGVAGLLGLHWTLDGREDDTPPGTELAFELWRSESGSYFVRTRIAMQTLTQMRKLQELTLAFPPAMQILTSKKDATNASRIRMEDFQSIAESVIDQANVFTLR